MLSHFIEWIRSPTRLQAADLEAFSLDTKYFFGKMFFSSQYINAMKFSVRYIVNCFPWIEQRYICAQ